jgi:hypothetical protein
LEGGDRRPVEKERFRDVIYLIRQDDNGTANGPELSAGQHNSIDGIEPVIL